MLWCCLSLILSMLNWTLRLKHQWNSVLLLNSIYYVHIMVVCSWKTVENCLVKILENLVSRVSIGQEFPSINWTCLFDRSNRNWESIESTRLFMLNLLQFRLIENSFRSFKFVFSIDRIRIGYQSSHPETWKFFDEDFDRLRNRFDRSKWTVFEISLSIKT